MASTSGTVGQTVILVSDIIDHILRRAGISAPNATPDIVSAAQQNLYFFLSGLANQGVNLWCIEKSVFGTQISKQTYDMPVGTVDILNALYRTVVLPADGTAYSSAGGTADNAFDQDLDTACIQTSADGYIYYNWGDDNDVTIVNVGVMSYGTKTYTLEFEYSTDGSTWTSVYSAEEQSYPDREWVYFDIEVPYAGQYFRVRETGGETLTVREVVFAQQPSQIPMARLNMDDYTNLINPTFEARSTLQYWFKRDRLQPQMWIWPTSNYSFDQIVVWRHRHIQDVGTLTNEIEVPQHWIESIVCEAALSTQLELPGLEPEAFNARRAALVDAAAKATKFANDEERDKSPIFFAPILTPYTIR